MDNLDKYYKSFGLDKTLPKSQTQFTITYTNTQ